MNEIIFPLSLDMQGDAVADLHAALQLLKLQVTEEEIHAKLYGESTKAAVCQFQTSNKLAVSGTVDEKTANALTLVSLSCAS